MSKYSVVVIGGGAAGICAAITAARSGRSVIIGEKTAQLGKKILASGDGRCNLLNENFTADFFNPAACELVNSVISQCGKSAILDYFHGLGLHVYNREGRIFPVTNQSASVLKVLEMELRRLAITVEYNFTCVEIKHAAAGFNVLAASGRQIVGSKVIVTGGGKTYPAFGADGSAYEIARKLGHSIVEPVPAVVPLVVKDNLCQRLQGQRIQAGAQSIVDGKFGEVVQGELLFTKYGLSGTCILDISEAISIAINRDHRADVEVAVDLVPFLNRDQLKSELAARLKQSIPPAEILCGILPNKCAAALQPELAADKLDLTVNALKCRRFKVVATRGWNEGEFTSGGINVAEVKSGTLESRLSPGIYFAGEILDVNGKRGGYNLGWAWSSGITAGDLH
jgi:predicted Rossmann fold flavoprotein